MPAALLRSHLPKIWRYAALAGLLAAVIVVAGDRGAPARSAVRPTTATRVGVSAPVDAPPARASRGLARKPRVQHARRPLAHHARRPHSQHARASRSHHRHGWINPVRGRVSSGFGRRWGSFHPGVDVAARYGRKVHAIVGGRVVSAGWIPGYGKTVRIRRDGRTFFYPHLSRIHVRHGHVRTGAFIGRVGSTGYSTGPHLHVEIRRHGRARNPLPILRHHGVRLGGSHHHVHHHRQHRHHRHHH